MLNFNIRLNLSLLPGAFTASLKGKQTTKKCLCIPLDEARLFCGKSGIYLDLSALEMQESKFGETHYIKANLPKEVYQQMTEEQRKAQPILGGLKPFAASASVAAPVVETAPEDDLPF